MPFVVRMGESPLAPRNEASGGFSLLAERGLVALPSRPMGPSLRVGRIGPSRQAGPRSLHPAAIGRTFLRRGADCSDVAH